MYVLVQGIFVNPNWIDIVLGSITILKIIFIKLICLIISIMLLHITVQIISLGVMNDNVKQMLQQNYSPIYQKYIFL